MISCIMNCTSHRKYHNYDQVSHTDHSCTHIIHRFNYFTCHSSVTRGQGYGVESIRVDGNDALAVYDVTDYARKVCIEESRPILIEAMTYRVGHHTTSDDSTKYRTEEEVLWWKENNCPITRLQGLLIDKKIWSLEEEQQFLESVSSQLNCIHKLPNLST